MITIGQEHRAVAGGAGIHQRVRIHAQTGSGPHDDALILRLRKIKSRVRIRNCSHQQHHSVAGHVLTWIARATAAPTVKAPANIGTRKDSTSPNSMMVLPPSLPLRT